MGSSTESESKPLLAGASKVVITPPAELQPVWLAGLGPGNRPSEGVHDDLYACALALSDGTATCVFVALDLIGYLQNETRALREQVEGANPDHIAICCTHQHSGPDTIGLWGPAQLQSGVSPAYMDFLRERVHEALAAAIHDLRRAKLALGSAQAEQGLVSNVRAGGALDNEVSVMQARDAQTGLPIATLVNFAAHPEILWYESRLLTAEFPGYLRRELEKQGGMGLFFNGAAGGMVTPNVTGNTFAEAERVGVSLAQTALSALGRAEEVDSLQIAARREFVEIAPDNELMKLGTQMGFLKYDLTEAGSFRAEVQAFQLRATTAVDGSRLAVSGSSRPVNRQPSTVNRPLAQIACFPGEPVPELGLRVKAAMTAPYRFVFGLANDELGYLLLPEHYGTEEYKLETRSCLGKQAGRSATEGLERMLGGCDT